ncbi:hypothetical protein DYB35_000119 [Aphanomyces astaci]|uniref:DUF3677 domain-containing protein n=1 Tax=Aphanomyces astaci TaxID=112090 RepID=A0A3R7E9W4_APHAT|nr:hypothetical protein DYB35_000119 [Aphanomyces astaci]
MKRVVYDESDLSSDPDDKQKDTSAKEVSDAEEELEDADMEEEDEETAPEKPPEPPADDKEVPKDEEEEKEGVEDDDDDDEAQDDDEDTEDTRQLLDNAQDDESVQRLIQSSLGQLARDGGSPSRELILAYASCVSSNPSKFQHPTTLKAMLRLLRSTFQGRERSSSVDKKAKPKPPREVRGVLPLAVLVANLLATILKNIPQNEWPDDCLKVFVDDSLHSRSWVDHSMCSVFVDMIKAHIAAAPSTDASVQRIMEHLSSKVTEIKKGGVNPTTFKHVMLTLMDLTPLPQGRLMASSNLELWFQHTTHKTIARDLLLKISCTTLDAPDLDTVENLLNMKFKTVSFPQLKSEVFTMLVRQRPEYINVAFKVVLLKERLAATLKDVDNLKMMPLIFRETAQGGHDSKDEQEPDNDVVFKRSPQHQHPGTATSRALAMVLQDLATASSNLPTLKNTLRKVLRSLTHDQLDVRALCQGLLVVPKGIQSFEFFVMMGELVALVLFVQGAAVRSLQVNVPDASSNPRLLPKAMDKGVRRLGTGAVASTPASNAGNTNGPVALGSLKSKPMFASKEPKHPAITPAVKSKEEFAQLIAHVQSMAIHWCHDVQELGDHLGMRLFGAVIRKVLFLDMLADMQATEHDRGCFNFCRDMLPLHASTVGRIVDMCKYANPEETLDILKVLEAVVVRASDAQTAREAYFSTQDQILKYQADGGVMGLKVDTLELVQPLLEAGTVRGHLYDGNAVCYSELFWLAHCILLVLAFNPESLGAFVWDNVPTMRSLMQMVITGRFKFPPVEPEDLKLFDKHSPPSMTLSQANQLVVERERALFEAHKLPVDQSLMVVQPLQCSARAPPVDVLRKVDALDKSLRLGLRLRKSRSTDFLMDMVDVAVSDKSSQSSWSERPERISWIVEIVCAELETLTYLPRRCLCELLLLACVDGGSDDKSKGAMHAMLLQQVPSILSRLKECNDDDDNVEVMTFFLNRLASPNVATRQLSAYLLDLLTRQGNSITTLSKAVPCLSFDWLPGLVSLPCFPALHERVIASLEALLKLESSVDALKLCLGALYDIFGNQAHLHLPLAVALGNFLVQRASVARLLLGDTAVFGRMVDTFWAAVERQVHQPTSQPHDLKGAEAWVTVAVAPEVHHGVSAVDLPASIVSGAIELLSFPTQQVAVSSFDHLVAFFFPPESTLGLWHPRQTYVCSSDHLFRLACVANTQLLSAAIQKMTLEVLWRVVLSYGRAPACLLAVLTALQAATVSRPDKCVDALTRESGAGDAAHACDEALVHLNMYLHQESFAEVRHAGDAMITWLKDHHEQPLVIPGSEDTRCPEKKNRFLALVTYPKKAPPPTSDLDSVVNVPAIMPHPSSVPRQYAATHDRLADMCLLIQDKSHRSSVLGRVHVASLGHTSSLVKLGSALAKARPVGFVQVFLHEIMALGCQDSTGVFLQSFLSQHTTDSLLPFASTVLDAMWTVMPWHVHGVWQRIVRLIVAEQAQYWPQTQQVDRTRLDLIHHVAFDIQDNMASTITALYNFEQVSADLADVERQVVEFIVMDLYASRPHSFVLAMDVCAPGWQLHASRLVHFNSSSRLESKIDRWLTSKDHADALRLVALRHPLLVTSRIVHVALSLEGRSALFVSKAPLDNWLMAIDLVAESVFRHPHTLKHLVQCFLLYLEHHHDESKAITALRVVHTVDRMIRKDSCAMLPFFTQHAYRIRCVSHFLDHHTIKSTEITSWTTTSPTFEDQLEELKTTFTLYAGSAKHLVLPTLTRYISQGEMTKKTTVLICQCLLLVLQSDRTSAGDATKAYVACLTSPKVGIREAATFFLPDFLVYCSPSQHYTILAHLFLEDSDVAKSSLSQYFKSDLFKADRS